MKKITLAIETSCDDTSISILEGVEVISLKTFSQIKENKKFGGVIPEIASRIHSKFIFKIINETLEDSGIDIYKIDQIVVTYGPGLVNTLQVGIIVAKTLALILNKPIYKINHIEAHAYSPFIGKEYNVIPQRAIVLVVSGGHTEIIVKNNWKLKTLGSTRDDAIGEVYDKVAKILKINYPGAPKIDEIANKTFNEVKCPKTNLENYDFSFSGLKTFVFNQSKNKSIKKNELIKGFQNSAIKQLIDKIKKAVNEFEIYDVIIGGGVSANSFLRSELNSIDYINLYLPKIQYTIDNAAMIGYLAVLKINQNLIEKENLEIDAVPKLDL